MINLYAATTLLSRLPVRDRDSNSIVPFRMNFNQRRFFAMLQRRVDAKTPLPLWAIIVKARRVGVSSAVDGLFTTEICRVGNTDAQIVAHLSDTSDALFRVPTDLMHSMPIPANQRNILKSEITVNHPEGRSRLSIATAGTKEGGRGGTLNHLHFSEAAFVSGEASFVSLLSSVGRFDSNMVFIESTANGKTGVGENFYKFWMDATAGRNDFLPIFLSWLDDLGCRRVPSADLLAGQLDEDEKDILARRGCATQCMRCERCHAALSACAWRKWAIYNLCSGYLERFHREYPIDADEAFTQTGDPAFTKEELRTAAITVQSRQLADNGVIELVDPTLDAAAQEEVADSTIQLYPDESRKRPAYTSTLMFRPLTSSPLVIYQHPILNYHYGIGADAARGIQRGDFAAAVGWCWETGEQVFRYSNKIPPDKFAQLLNLVGRYYNGAMIAIERTGNLGLWAQQVLRDQYKYRNLYRWKGTDSKVVVGQVLFKTSSIIGWETTTKSRELLLSAFRGGVREALAKVRDDILLSQMRSAENVSGRWEVNETIHDDILMAAMIGWITRVQWYNVSPISTKTKQLDTGVMVNKDTGDKRVLPGSQGDPQEQHRTHWNKLIKYIKRGGPPADRLRGV